MAFTNAIQDGLIYANSKPTKEQYETVEKGFWLLIENLKPQKLIVCSQEIWKYWMPDEDDRSHYVTKIVSGNKESTVWKYQHLDGFCYAIAINHPSWGVSKDTKGLIDEFLATDF